MPPERVVVEVVREHTFNGPSLTEAIFVGGMRPSRRGPLRSGHRMNWR